MTTTRRLPEPTDIGTFNSNEKLVSEKKLRGYFNQLLRVLNFSFEDTYNEIEKASKTNFTDYSSSATDTFSTSLAKIDFSNTSLVFETQSLFDKTNSRIIKMPFSSFGHAIVSLTVDTSSGTNHWVDLQLRGFDINGTQLFAKTPSTVPLVKNKVDEEVHTTLEFYFGDNVDYFEVWGRASSALDYANLSITVVKF